jgi:hypothetical protein
LGTEGPLVRSLVLSKADVKRKKVKMYIPAPDEFNTDRFFGCSLPLGIDVVVAHTEGAYSTKAVVYWKILISGSKCSLNLGKTGNSLHFFFNLST